MSETILTLVPTHPEYLPDAQAAQEALAVFTSFVPQGEETILRVTKDVEFVDIGENLQRITCPACGSSVRMEWWLQAMDTAYQASTFADLLVTMPCCSAMISLNDLQYDWPAGFTRFRLETHNPNTDISEQALQTLEHLLGCQLRKIWASF